MFTKKTIFLIGVTFIGSLQFCNNLFNHISASDLGLSVFKEMILKSSWIIKYLWPHLGYNV